MVDRERIVERRADLKAYILKCLRDNVFSLADLATGDAFERVLKAVSTDFRAVIAEIGRDGGSVLLKRAGHALSHLADIFGPGGSRR